MTNQRGHIWGNFWEQRQVLDSEPDIPDGQGVQSGWRESSVTGIVWAISSNSVQPAGE